MFGCDGAFSATRRAMERRGRYDTRIWYATQGYKELHVPPTADGGWAWQNRRRPTTVFRIPSFWRMGETGVRALNPY